LAGFYPPKHKKIHIGYFPQTPGLSFVEGLRPPFDATHGRHGAKKSGIFGLNLKKNGEVCE
jgi:hypothetical protein